MNYDSRFSYNLTIPIMKIRKITTKSDEMRHIKASLKSGKKRLNQIRCFETFLSKAIVHISWVPDSPKKEISFLGESGTQGIVHTYPKNFYYLQT